jgi:hypothetical protein
MKLRVRGSFAPDHGGLDCFSSSSSLGAADMGRLQLVEYPILRSHLLRLQAFFKCSLMSVLISSQ